MPCEITEILKNFPPDPHGFFEILSSECIYQEMKILKILSLYHEHHFETAFIQPFSIGNA